MKKEIIETFEKLFGDSSEVKLYFAPGRVNLIGEHTDYNGGHVFPCALTIGTYGAVRKREDRKLCFYSMNFEHIGVIESNLDDLVPSKEANWTNYPKGVIWTFEKNGYEIPSGFDIVLYGNIPNGSGLSSSASLEVLTGLILKEEMGFEKLNMTEIALMGQYAENHFNGMNCGIMDQFVSAMGKKKHAIFLDTNTLKFEYVPIQLEDSTIVITNSKVKHSLVDSKYNERRKECEEALKELQTVVSISSLGDLSEAQFEQYKDAIKSKIRKKRAKHAVYENQRTIKAVEYLREGNIGAFGELMNASHISLRDDYEVSCAEVDVLTELAWKEEAVLGARITGGGFGGCVVSIVKKNGVDHFMKTIKEEYQERVGIDAEFYVVDIGDGAKRLV